MAEHKAFRHHRFHKPKILKITNHCVIIFFSFRKRGVFINEPENNKNLYTKTRCAMVAVYRLVVETYNVDWPWPVGV